MILLQTLQDFIQKTSPESSNYGKKGLHSPHLNRDKALEKLHPGKFMSMATNGAFQSWEIGNNKQ